MGVEHKGHQILWKKRTKPAKRGWITRQSPPKGKKTKSQPEKMDKGEKTKALLWGVQGKKLAQGGGSIRKCLNAEKAGHGGTE